MFMREMSKEEYDMEFGMPHTPFKFSIGDEVHKINGYSFQGYVDSNFITRAKKRRIVVEHRDIEGLLHIFNEDQFERGWG